MLLHVQMLIMPTTEPQSRKREIKKKNWQRAHCALFNQHRQRLDIVLNNFAHVALYPTPLPMSDLPQWHFWKTKWNKAVIPRYYSKETVGVNENNNKQCYWEQLQQRGKRIAQFQCVQTKTEFIKERFDCENSNLPCYGLSISFSPILSAEFPASHLVSSQSIIKVEMCRKKILD